jgi:hypothetical protein
MSLEKIFALAKRADGYENTRLATVPAYKAVFPEMRAAPRYGRNACFNWRGWAVQVEPDCNSAKVKHIWFFGPRRT